MSLQKYAALLRAVELGSSSKAAADAALKLIHLTQDFLARSLSGKPVDPARMFRHNLCRNSDVSRLLSDKGSRSLPSERYQLLTSASSSGVHSP